MAGIKIASDQLRLMSLFQKKTHVTARDCVEDPKFDRVIFVVGAGMAGKAIGRGGTNIRAAQEAIKRNIEVAEHADDPEGFLANVLGSKLVRQVKINRNGGGAVSATAMVDPAKKAMAIGREGRNIAKARLLAERYFGITHVSVEGEEAAVQEA